MRNKDFFITLTSLVVFFWCLILLRSEYRISFQSFVSKASTFRRAFGNNNSKDEPQWNVDEKYMALLGFTDNPRIYPHEIWLNTTLPVIVTTLFPGDAKMGIGFAKNTAHMAGNHSVLIYNIGLSSSELQSVAAHCNTSQCQIVPFDVKSFPSHIQDDPAKTVKALVIQDALNKAGGILYLENEFRIISDIDPLLQMKPIGCFKTKRAVSTLTHPNMISFFKAEVEDFEFLAMIETNRLLLWNTVEIHLLLMRQWIQCVLTSECVRPIGAQSNGCRFNKKPQYRYSGCHHYATSALNVVLGKLYQFRDSPYTFPMPDTFFTLATAEENTTLS